MKNILVVDLDGTLVFTDMLYESFWSAFSKDWTILIKSFFWLLKGKAYLKNNLYRVSDIDVTNLPYNNEVIDLIKKYRKKSTHIALVTASNQNMANKIANYLNIFDEVKGSTKKINLQGKLKANFLKIRYGTGGFDYVGDSFDDLHSWKKAKKAILVNNDPSIIKACRKVNSNFKQLKTKSSKNLILEYIKTIRAYQWIKNVLVFAPMFAANQLTLENLNNSSIAFIAFCLSASSAYLFNDLLDLKADRSHSYKKFRPIANGSISIKNAMILLLAMFLSSILLAYSIGVNFSLTIFTYWLISISYSLIIKKIVILDIFVLCILYTFRIYSGGVATEIPLSFWLLVFSIFLFLSLAAIKRQSELVNLKKSKKSKLVLGRGYSIEDLPFVSMIALSAGFISVLIAGFYINSSEIMILYSKIWSLWLSCVTLILWLIKILYASSKGLIIDDPIIYALKDNASRICLIMILFLFAINFI